MPNVIILCEQLLEKAANKKDISVVLLQAEAIGISPDHLFFIAVWASIKRHLECFKHLFEQWKNKYPKEGKLFNFPEHLTPQIYALLNCAVHESRLEDALQLVTVLPTHYTWPVSSLTPLYWVEIMTCVQIIDQTPNNELLKKLADFLVENREGVRLTQQQLLENKQFDAYRHCSLYSQAEASIQININPEVQTTPYAMLSIGYQNIPAGATVFKSVNEVLEFLQQAWGKRNLVALGAFLEHVSLRSENSSQKPSDQLVLHEKEEKGLQISDWQDPDFLTWFTYEANQRNLNYFEFLQYLFPPKSPGSKEDKGNELTKGWQLLLHDLAPRWLSFYFNRAVNDRFLITHENLQPLLKALAQADLTVDFVAKEVIKAMQTVDKHPNPIWLDMFNHLQNNAICKEFSPVADLLAQAMKNLPSYPSQSLVRPYSMLHSWSDSMGIPNANLVWVSKNLFTDTVLAGKGEIFRHIMAFGPDLASTLHNTSRIFHQAVRASEAHISQSFEQYLVQTCCILEENKRQFQRLKQAFEETVENITKWERSLIGSIRWSMFSVPAILIAAIGTAIFQPDYFRESTFLSMFTVFCTTSVVSSLHIITVTGRNKLKTGYWFPTKEDLLNCKLTHKVYDGNRDNLLLILRQITQLEPIFCGLNKDNTAEEIRNVLGLKEGEYSDFRQKVETKVANLQRKITIYQTQQADKAREAKMQASDENRIIDRRTQREITNTQAISVVHSLNFWGKKSSLEQQSLLGNHAVEMEGLLEQKTPRP